MFCSRVHFYPVETVSSHFGSKYVEFYFSLYLNFNDLLTFRWFIYSEFDLLNAYTTNRNKNDQSASLDPDLTIFIYYIETNFSWIRLLNS